MAEMTLIFVEAGIIKWLLVGNKKLAVVYGKRAAVAEENHVLVAKNIPDMGPRNSFGLFCRQFRSKEV